MKAPNEYDFIMLSLRCQHIRSRHIHDADSFIICVCNSIFIAFTTICSHLTNTNFTLLSLSDYKYIFFVCLFLVFYSILFLASVENHFCMWFSMCFFFYFFHSFTWTLQWRLFVFESPNSSAVWKRFYSIAVCDSNVRFSRGYF